MSSRQSAVPENLPEDFFDSDKKTKKEQQGEIAKALEEKKKEIAAREADLEKQLEEEFEVQQNETNVDELEQQLKQWERFAELEKKAQHLQEKTASGKSKNQISSMETEESNNADADSDGDEDFEDKLFNWRSKGL